MQVPTESSRTIHRTLSLVDHHLQSGTASIQSGRPIFCFKLDHVGSPGSADRLIAFAIYSRRRHQCRSIFRCPTYDRHLSVVPISAGWTRTTLHQEHKSLASRGRQCTALYTGLPTNQNDYLNPDIIDSTSSANLTSFKELALLVHLHLLCTDA